MHYFIENTLGELISLNVTRGFRKIFESEFDNSYLKTSTRNYKADEIYVCKLINGDTIHIHQNEIFKLKERGIIA